MIPPFVACVCGEFVDLDELRNVVRNCDRLFPPFNHITNTKHQPRRAKQLKAKFVVSRVKKFVAEVSWLAWDAT